MYAGLPIMTNKISESEQQGIPHHLLGHVSLNDEPAIIETFQHEAQQTIRGIRDRGNLPILVGGTAYYVDALLFDDVVVNEEYSKDEHLPILDESTEVMLEELKKVDPEHAERWHPNDRRKIQRSLEIYLRTGKPASQIYAEQKARRQGARESPWQNLLFWVYSDPDVLKPRLDARVDKMLEAGLMNEVFQLFAHKKSEEAQGRAVHLDKGIWQSIGYRQFEPYLKAKEEGVEGSELEKLRQAGIEDMKTATRRYANYQNKWTRTKKIPRLKEEGPQALDALYLLDSTNVSLFKETVIEPAVELTTQFLAGAQRKHPSEVSELAKRVLEKHSVVQPETVWMQRTCDLCQKTLVTEASWLAHLKTRQHRAKLKYKKRRSLVPYEGAGVLDGDSNSVHDGESSDPEISSIFQ